MVFSALKVDSCAEATAQVLAVVVLANAASPVLTSPELDEARKHKAYGTLLNVTGVILTAVGFVMFAFYGYSYSGSPDAVHDSGTDCETRKVAVPSRHGQGRKNGR